MPAEFLLEIEKLRFWPFASSTMKYASSSSTDQGAGNRRGLMRSIRNVPSNDSKNVEMLSRDFHGESCHPFCSDNIGVHHYSNSHDGCSSLRCPSPLTVSRPLSQRLTPSSAGRSLPSRLPAFIAAPCTEPTDLAGAAASVMAATATASAIRSPLPRSTGTVVSVMPITRWMRLGLHPQNPERRASADRRFLFARRLLWL
jgi:hypothetical protein